MMAAKSKRPTAAVTARENATRGGVQMRWIIVLAMVLVFGCAGELSEEEGEETNEETSEAPTR